MKKKKRTFLLIKTIFLFPRRSYNLLIEFLTITTKIPQTHHANFLLFTQDIKNLSLLRDTNMTVKESPQNDDFLSKLGQNNFPIKLNRISRFHQPNCLLFSIEFKVLIQLRNYFKNKQFLNEAQESFELFKVSQDMCDIMFEIRAIQTSYE